MTASLLRSVLRRSVLPALCASFVVVGAGCDDNSGVCGTPSYSSNGNRKDTDGDPDRAPKAPPTCASAARVTINAPAALQEGVDTSTLWVRACVDDRCVDQPLLARDLLNDGAESTLAKGTFATTLRLDGVGCAARNNVVAVSIYDTLTKAPLYTEAREVSLICASAECRQLSFLFDVPDESFTCQTRGALVRLTVPEAIALPRDASPTAIVCVDDSCSEAIFLPLTSVGLGPGLGVDVFLQGIERSSVEVTKHELKLMLSSAATDIAPYSETFELLLDPTTSLTCGAQRAPDFVLPLQPDMFALPPDPGGGRPPPYSPPPAPPPAPTPAPITGG